MPPPSDTAQNEVVLPIPAQNGVKATQSAMSGVSRHKSLYFIKKSAAEAQKIGGGMEGMPTHCDKK
jgi:hypothetical protein